ncbi:hypothetical protein ACAG24_020110 [Mycobacterium sp. pW049]|uniref:hypothetical protein n=1 Tax=[Mycobacterium] bulgaricum TaxID=3238985 RepID=UPI00351B5FA2
MRRSSPHSSIRRLWSSGFPPAGMTGHFDHFDARTMTWTVTPVAGGMTSLANLAAHLAARHSSPHRRGGGQPTR